MRRCCRCRLTIDPTYNSQAPTPTTPKTLTPHHPPWQFGPICATLLPLPLVVLSPFLSLSSKILAFILPSCAHIMVGYWLVSRG